MFNRRLAIMLDLKVAISFNRGRILLKKIHRQPRTFHRYHTIIGQRKKCNISRCCFNCTNNSINRQQKERVFFSTIVKDPVNDNQPKSEKPSLLPLEGIRVLDLTRILAGPFCSMLLADMGCEVIKVEHPIGGDDTRRWGPPFTEKGKESAYFLCVNRNKKSICVNLKKKEGIKIIEDLVAQSDVLIENYLPGKLDSMGLGYDHLSKINPKLIYCSISGFGADGPLASRPGFDVIVQAMYGLMSITGNEGENSMPCKTGVALTDISTGLFAHGAIIAALYSRETTGRGQKIETSLMESQLACLANVASNSLIGDIKEPKRWGTAHESIVPYQAFQCQDGKQIVFMCANDANFKSLCSIISMEKLSDDTRFLTNGDRVKNRTILIDLLAKKFETKGLQEWMELFQNDGTLAFGPVRNIGEAFEDQQAQHRGMVQKVQHPTAGEISIPGFAVKYSETEMKLRMPPPLLGQHTSEVLAEVLKYSDDEIQTIYNDKDIIA